MRVDFDEERGAALVWIDGYDGARVVRGFQTASAEYDGLGLRRVEDLESGVHVHVDKEGHVLAIEDGSGRARAFVRDVARLVSKTARFLERERKAAAEKAKGGSAKIPRSSAAPRLPK